ncbi:MAG TPA: TRAP transporter substrate-binding protein DctP [Kofleriaceae bacterium]|nr:TRAP transporter substrate-binding protein DctP [Kofleriaceae bacterium]
MRTLLALSFVAAAASAVAADPVELRVATLAPPDSTWMKILDKGSADIAQKTDQRVTLKWYPGGVQGDERDFIRKIGLGQLDGAAVTSIGLSMIDESIRVLELPMMFDSIEEMDYVADKMWPYFQKKFEKKGYKLTDRGEIGWIYFMSKDKIESLADLKNAKVWQWGDDQIVAAMYRKLNISGVPLGVPEVDAALTSGRINACYGSPLAAVALQWNTKVKYMTSMPMSYGLGATVMSLDAYKKLAPEDAKTMLKLANKMGGKVRVGVRKDNKDAQKQMIQKGVKVVQTPAAMVSEFTKASQEVWKELVGKVYSQEELDMVLKYRDEYRAKHSGTAPAAPAGGATK